MAQQESVCNPKDCHPPPSKRRAGAKGQPQPGREVEARPRAARFNQHHRGSLLVLQMSAHRSAHPQPKLLVELDLEIHFFFLEVSTPGDCNVQPRRGLTTLEYRIGEKEDAEKMRRVSGRASASRILLVFYFLTP